MLQSLNDRIEHRYKEIRNTIDDYNDTIHAIIGFVNLYLLDESYKPRPQMKAFQGRHLIPLITEHEPTKSTNEYYVSPDLGIVFEKEKGILGEVQKNFPKEEIERGKKVFVQLKNYDQNLMGWPVNGEAIDSHEIVLLVHLTTSAYAKEFYEKQLPNIGISFERPFSIVEFGRFTQAEEFFLFRKVIGDLTEVTGEKKLWQGIPVPMRVFLSEYSKTKIYDAQPPIPYLAELIWVHVVTPIASDSPKFEHLRKKQIIEVILSIDDIVDRLNEGFSFRFWHITHPGRQPRIPHREWVRQACNFLIDCHVAEWIQDSQETKLRIFYQRYEDVMEYFTRLYATLEEQRKLTPFLPGFGSSGN